MKVKGKKQKAGNGKGEKAAGSKTPMRVKREKGGAQPRGSLSAKLKEKGVNKKLSDKREQLKLSAKALE